MMYFIDNKGITDPRINLAIEEYVLKNMDIEKDNFLLFYINQPSVIIGKNQNTIEEINTDYVEENGIIVVRRLSGGGAVYHDLGNLNFSFLTKDDGNSFHNYKKFTQNYSALLTKNDYLNYITSATSLLCNVYDHSDNWKENAIDIYPNMINLRNLLLMH